MGICISLSMCTSDDTIIEEDKVSSVRFPRKKPKPIIIVPNRPRSTRFRE